MTKRLGPILRLPVPTRPVPESAFSAELAEVVITSFSRDGDLVFDPFAGTGTTLAVADRLGRRALGIELVPEHVRFCRARAPRATLLEADARRVAELVAEPIDLVLTSPPYRTRTDHPQDPLDGYRTHSGDYASYLGDLAGIFEALAPLIASSGLVVVNVGNLRVEDEEVTPLAWDLWDALRPSYALVEDVVVDQPGAAAFLTTDVLLVLRPR